MMMMDGFKNTSTAALRKRLAELDALASFAVENVGHVDDGIHEEYRTISEEIARRDEAFHRAAAVREWETVFSDFESALEHRHIFQLLRQVGLGFVESDDRRQVLVNPRNVLFEEIVVTVKAAHEEQPFSTRAVVSSMFILREGPSLAEVRRRYQDLSVGTDSGGVAAYDLTFPAGGLKGRIQFVFTTDNGTMRLKTATAWQD